MRRRQWLKMELEIETSRQTARVLKFKESMKNYKASFKVCS